MKGTCILLQVEWDAIETLVFGFKVKSEGGVVKSKMGQLRLIMNWHNLWVEITAQPSSEAVTANDRESYIMASEKRKGHSPQKWLIHDSMHFC